MMNRKRSTEGSSREPSKIWVLAPGRARSVVKKLGSEQRPDWCYLGSNLSMSDKAGTRLGPARRVYVAEELNATAHELKQTFIDWVAEMGKRQKDKANWWASRLASKSPLQTDFFLLVCYSRLVQRWVESRTPVIRIVLVEDPWLRWVLRRRFANDPRVHFDGGYRADCLARSVYWLARAPLAMALMFVSSVYSLIWSRLSFGKQPAPDLQGESAVLLYTWIERKSFSSAAKIHDAHTGRLEEILRRRGETVLRMTPIEIPSSLFRPLKTVSSTVVITTSWMNLIDVFLSLLAWFRIDDVGRLASFQNCDYKPLLRREVLFEWGSTSFPRYYLWYRTMRRVAKGCGLRIKCLIYPFENQPWEKLMCLAWREEAPRVQLVGYQHSRVPPLLLPYALSSREVAIVPLPDTIVTNGAATLESLRAAGFPEAKLANGGALRYEYFYSGNGNGSAPANPADAARETGPRTVLVAFPLSRPHCRGLLVDLLEEFARPLFLDDAQSIAVEIVLKCHPWLPLEKFYRGKATPPPWISFSERAMESELARADALLYVPSTTSWREAYVAGIPVLKYELDLLDIDPPESFNGFAVYPCRKETLRTMVQKLLAEPPVRRKPPAAVLGKIFGRVDENLWARIVQRGHEKPRRLSTGPLPAEDSNPQL